MIGKGMGRRKIRNAARLTCALTQTDHLDLRVGIDHLGHQSLIKLFARKQVTGVVSRDFSLLNRQMHNIVKVRHVSHRKDMSL